MTVPDPGMRAGDRDRDSTIDVLREAFAEGRLTDVEFEQRLGQVHQARTFGELALITSDLPTLAGPPSPAPAVTSADTVGEVEPDHSVRNGWASWLGVAVLVNVIWGATWMTEGGSAPYYWPIWVMGPWGAAMLIRTLSHRD